MYAEERRYLFQPLLVSTHLALSCRALVCPAHCPTPQPASLADLAGGDRNTNAKIVWRLLRNQERGPKRDAILLNAAAALFVAGKTKSLVAGWDLAGELIESGKAEAKLNEIVRASR